MKNTIKEISEFVEQQGTLVQEYGFEQVPVHHLTTKSYKIDGHTILYIGKDTVFCESKAKYLYQNLDSSVLIEILKLTQ